MLRIVLCIQDMTELGRDDRFFFGFFFFWSRGKKHRLSRETIRIKRSLNKILSCAG